ncbi:BioY family transporter [Actinobacteria bacterium YIM 96077]|uniref:Biotin transporter n=1 Tax=Phytoactinopolyspora halophila TaxID=1981511 RepID=A0A329R3P7_9ACTN|nr:biotin transporter BioY [Phytoactinopolyspora halophila]AYY12105.1 BioY family transporter [Actinobacteria bacterium YIM 96077]RAW18659.1 BioY family transporter [Phytoactinopolyspora halophila]
MTEPDPSAPRPPKRRLPAADLARIAAFAALLAVLGLPGSFALFGNAVPITLQTLGVLLAGAILGTWRGALTIMLLLALVAAGLPLLAGGRGGLGVFAGPSVGYLFAWVLAAAAVGWLVERGGYRPRMPWVLAACLIGSTLILVVGVPVQALITGVPLGTTAALSLAFVPGDALKSVVAAAVVVGVQRGYPDAAPAVRRARRRRDELGHDAAHGDDRTNQR